MLYGNDICKWHLFRFLYYVIFNRICRIKKPVMWQWGENLCTNKLIISMSPHSFKKGVNSLKSSMKSWAVPPCPKLSSKLPSTFTVIRTPNLINCRSITKRYEDTLQNSGEACFEIHIWDNKHLNSSMQ